MSPAKPRDVTVEYGPTGDFLRLTIDDEAFTLPMLRDIISHAKADRLLEFIKANAEVGMLNTELQARIIDLEDQLAARLKASGHGSTVELSPELVRSLTNWRAAREPREPPAAQEAPKKRTRRKTRPK